jgi:hypothetical protein
VRTIRYLAAIPLLVAGAPMSAAPIDTSPPVLHSISYSQSDVTVSGLQTVNVTVSVHLTDDSGVTEFTDMDGQWYPHVYFVDSGVSNTTVNLRRATGTPQDGVWTGVAVVTSAWKNGAVQPSRLAASDIGEANRLVVDPRTLPDTPAITVHPSHHPTLAVTITPDPVLVPAKITMHVQARDADTGRPWAGLRLWAGGVGSVTTDAFGRYQRSFPSLPLSVDAQTAYLYGPVNSPQDQTVIAFGAAFVNYRYVVSAKPAAASWPARTNLNVTGKLFPGTQRKTLHLQRLVGTTWTTVNSTATRSSAAFTVVATPPRGTSKYRVYAPSDGSYAGNTSATFTIRGT